MGVGCGRKLRGRTATRVAWRASEVPLPAAPGGRPGPCLSWRGGDRSAFRRARASGAGSASALSATTFSSGSAAVQSCPCSLRLLRHTDRPRGSASSWRGIFRGESMLSPSSQQASSPTGSAPAACSSSAWRPSQSAALDSRRRSRPAPGSQCMPHRGLRESSAGAGRVGSDDALRGRSLRASGPFSTLYGAQMATLTVGTSIVLVGPASMRLLFVIGAVAASRRRCLPAPRSSRPATRPGSETGLGTSGGTGRGTGSALGPEPGPLGLGGTTAVPRPHPRDSVGVVPPSPLVGTRPAGRCCCGCVARQRSTSAFPGRSFSALPVGRARQGTSPGSVSTDEILGPGGLVSSRSVLHSISLRVRLVPSRRTRIHSRRGLLRGKGGSS